MWRSIWIWKRKGLNLAKKDCNVVQSTFHLGERFQGIAICGKDDSSAYWKNSASFTAYSLILLKDRLKSKGLRIESWGVLLYIKCLSLIIFYKVYCSGDNQILHKFPDWNRCPCIFKFADYCWRVYADCRTLRWCPRRQRLEIPRSLPESSSKNTVSESVMQLNYRCRLGIPSVREEEVIVTLPE